MNETQIYTTNEVSLNLEETIENYNYKIVSLTYNVNQDKRTPKPNHVVFAFTWLRKIHVPGRQACLCFPTLLRVKPFMMHIFSLD